MILIKLGGSIITNKERPLSPRRKTIDNILKEISKIKEPVVMVHGGGSYGHYWSVKYDMHTKPAKTAPKGVAVVKTIETGIIHPTINYQNVDPECDLDYVPNKSRKSKVVKVLSNNFGFGGQNACIVYGAFEE